MTDETPVFSTPPVSDPQPAADAPSPNGNHPPIVDAAEPESDRVLRELTLNSRALEEINMRLATMQAELFILLGVVALAIIVVWKTRTGP
jgi:hypothetical protein